MVQNYTFNKKWPPHWHSGGINVKKSGNVKWDARAASQIILKSLDCLEILENGYNLKEMIFSAPKWAGQGGQISLGPSSRFKPWRSRKNSITHPLVIPKSWFVKLPPLFPKVIDGTKL